ncbi:transcriptional regulator NrdR [Symmachiella dynata]|uniref:Transcriptional regulator NrdR n=1 Tax=Symmachiella dynata TaxID=2527995 RepID=A0A517ZPB6_9PLAN|nr:transcriptional regulator NrdR [Symmachiella dynata]
MIERQKCDDRLVHQRGLQCGACGHRRLRVIYTRAAKGGKLVRRRECRKCGERITTWECVIGNP